MKYALGNISINCAIAYLLLHVCHSFDNSGDKADVCPLMLVCRQSGTVVSKL